MLCLALFPNVFKDFCEYIREGSWPVAFPFFSFGLIQVSVLNTSLGSPRRAKQTEWNCTGQDGCPDIVL